MLGRTLFLCLITIIVLIIIVDLIDARRFRSFRPSGRRATRRNSSPSNNRLSRTGTTTSLQRTRGQRASSTSSRRASSNIRRTNPSTSLRRTSQQRSRFNTRRSGTTNAKTTNQRRVSPTRRTTTTRRGSTQSRRVSTQRSATTSRRRGTSNQRRTQIATTQNRRRNSATTSRRRGSATQRSRISIQRASRRRGTAIQTFTTEATPETTTSDDLLDTTTIQPPTAETQVLPTKTVSDIPLLSTSPISLVQLIQSATIESPVTANDEAATKVESLSAQVSRSNITDEYLKIPTQSVNNSVNASEANATKSLNELSIANSTGDFDQTLAEPYVTHVERIKLVKTNFASDIQVTTNKKHPTSTVQAQTLSSGRPNQTENEKSENRIETAENVTEASTSSIFSPENSTVDSVKLVTLDTEPAKSVNSSAFASPLINIPIPFVQTTTKSESKVILTSKPDVSTGNSTSQAALPKGTPVRIPIFMSGSASPPAVNITNRQTVPKPRKEIFNLQKLRIPFMMTALAPQPRASSNILQMLSEGPPFKTSSVPSANPQQFGMEIDQGKIDAELSKIMTESDLNIGRATQGGPGPSTMTSRALPVQPKVPTTLSLTSNKSPSFSTTIYQNPSHRYTTITQGFRRPQQIYSGTASHSSYSSSQAMYRTPYNLQGSPAPNRQPIPIQTPYQPYYSPTAPGQYTQYSTGSNRQTKRASTSIYQRQNLPYGGQQHSGPGQYTAPLQYREPATAQYGTQIGLKPRYGIQTPSSIQYMPYAGSSIQYAPRRTQYSTSGVPYRAAQPRYTDQSYRVPQHPPQPVYQAQYIVPQEPYNPTKVQYAQSTQNAQNILEQRQIPYAEQQTLYSPIDSIEPQVRNLVKEVEEIIAQADAPLGPNFKDSMKIIDPTRDLLAMAEKPARSSVTPNKPSGNNTIQTVPSIGEAFNINAGNATIQGSALQTAASNAAIQFTCPLAFGLFPHPQSCIRFMACSRNTPHERPCPGGLVFNEKANGEGFCDYENNVKGCCGHDKSTCPSNV